MAFQPQDSAIYEENELWELPEFPPEFRGCLVKISEDGLVLELTRKISKDEKIAISQEAGWFLEFLADEWGSVCLKWEGYFKMFGANIISSGNLLGGGRKSMSEFGSLINPENFDRLLKAQRIFGSAMSGIDYPLLKALEKMVESQYPCALVRLEDTRQLWINDLMLEQGLEVDVEEGIGREMTNYWLPAELELVNKNLQLCDSAGFDLSHKNVIFPPKWGNFQSHFDRIDTTIGTSRLIFMKEFEEIPNPLTSSP